MTGPPGPGPASPARPDASMSLLLGLMDQPLEPGYAEAAAARGHRPRPRRGRVALLAALVGLGLLLVTAGLQTRRAAPDADRERQDLIARIDERTEAADREQARVERLRDEVAAAEAEALAVADRSGATGERLADLRLAAGTTAVTGPGIAVTVDDAAKEADVPGGADDEEGLDRVLDTDLQVLVNGLWDAGAEAVAINGRRLTSLTAIRSAGDAVLVDFRPLVPPYRVEAIGDPNTLETGLVDGPAGRWFTTLEEAYGITFRVDTNHRLRLPAASTVTLYHAKGASR